jgi:hypothetical protein
MLLISFVSLGFYSESNKITGYAVDESSIDKNNGLETITGNLVKISGMVTVPISDAAYLIGVEQQHGIPKGTLTGIWCAESSCKKGTSIRGDSDNSWGPFQLGQEIRSNSKYTKHPDSGQPALNPDKFSDAAIIAARFIKDEIMTKTNYDNSNPKVGSYQIQVAYNRNPKNIPSSSDVQKVLNGGDPKILYITAAKNSHVNQRHINFISGYNRVQSIGVASIPTDQTKEDSDAPTFTKGNFYVKDQSADKGYAEYASAQAASDAYGGNKLITILTYNEASVDYEKSKSSTAVDTSGKFKYIFQYKDKSGNIKDGQVSIDIKDSTEAKKIAERVVKSKGFTLEGEVSRPKFSVTIDGISKPFENIEANNRNEAIIEAKKRAEDILPTGTDLSKVGFTVKDQVDVVAKPKDYIAKGKYVTSPDGSFKEYASAEEASNEATKLNDELKIKRNKETAEKYVKDALKLKENKEKKLTGEVTESGELLARDSNTGEIYKFIPIEENGRITEGSFQSVGDTYTTKETIGDLTIITTFEQNGEDTVEYAEQGKVLKDSEECTEGCFIDTQTAQLISDFNGKGIDISGGEGSAFYTFNLGDGKFKEIYTQDIANFKSTKFYETSYIRNGEVISKKKFDSLTKEEQKKIEGTKIENKRTLVVVETDKIIVRTDYEYDIKLKRSIGNSITIDKDTRKRVYKYVECNTENKCMTVTFKDGKANNCEGWFCNEEGVMARADEKQNQDVSKQYFALAETILTNFQGLGYYATFFFEDEELDAWRESVDEIFATLYLGTEYWTSDICQTYTDMEGKGIAYVDTKLGLAGVGAHIEATRSDPIHLPAGVESGDAAAGILESNQTTDNIDERRGIITSPREFLYKITFNVKNGDYDTDPTALSVMRFNIILKGEREAKLYKTDIELEKGEDFGAIKQSAIVQYSNFLYDQVCIEFDEVPSRWTLDDDELCNTISEASGPTSVGESQQATQQQESAGGNILDI